MAEKLTEFLTNLSTDPDLADAFKQDKVGTMKAYGVPDEHIELVVNKDYDGIRQVLGPDYDITTNSLIHATKK